MKTNRYNFYTFVSILLAILFLVSCQKKPQYIDSYVIIKEGRYGLIDSLGKEIVAPRFLYIEPIRKDGVALAIIDTIYTSMRDSSILGIRNKPILNIKYGYITKESKFIFPKPSIVRIPIDGVDSKDEYSQFCQNFSFYGGLAVVQDTATMRYGYIGLDGDTIISAKYFKARMFMQGRAAVQLDYSESIIGGKWGLINPQGDNICDFVFSDLETPFNGRAIAYIDINSDFLTISFNTFLVDKNGKIISQLDPTFHYFNFSKDGIAVAEPNRVGEFLGRKSCKFIKKDGEFIKPIDVNNISEKQAQEIIDNKHFLSFLPIDFEFTEASYFEDGYAAVNLGRAWIFVDSNLILRGNEECPIYENALPFSYGLAGVKLKGKFGYIDNDFNIVIPCKYDSCAIAGKNLCRVYSGKKTEQGYSIVSYINRKNKIVWQNINYKDYKEFYFEQREVKQNGEWRDNIAYDYIGKDFTLVWVCLIFILLIIVIYLVGRKNKRKIILNELKDKQNITDGIPTLKTEDSQKGDTGGNREKIKSQRTIDDRVNDILKL